MRTIKKNISTWDRRRNSPRSACWPAWLYVVCHRLITPSLFPSITSWFHFQCLAITYSSRCDQPMPVWCWSSVYDIDPTSNRHWVSVACLLGRSEVHLIPGFCEDISPQPLLFPVGNCETQEIQDVVATLLQSLRRRPHIEPPFEHAFPVMRNGCAWPKTPVNRASMAWSSLCCMALVYRADGAWFRPGEAPARKSEARWRRVNNHINSYITIRPRWWSCGIMSIGGAQLNESCVQGGIACSHPSYDLASVHSEWFLLSVGWLGSSAFCPVM